MLGFQQDVKGTQTSGISHLALKNHGGRAYVRLHRVCNQIRLLLIQLSEIKDKEEFIHI